MRLSSGRRVSASMSNGATNLCGWIVGRLRGRYDDPVYAWQVWITKGSMDVGMTKRSKGWCERAMTLW